MTILVNFRSTVGYRSDDGADAYIETGANAYPYPSGLGYDVGWESPSGSFTYENNSTGGDPRTGGAVRAPAWTVNNYRIELPSSGDYDISLALGTLATSPAAVYSELYDNTTKFGSTIGLDTSVSNGSFYDASGVERTSSASWVTDEVRVSRTFTSTTFKLKVLGGGNAKLVAHIGVYPVGGGVEQGAGASSGVAAASAVGSSLAKSAASSAGVAACAAVGAALLVAVGSCSGVATASAAGNAVYQADGASSGVASVSAVGRSISQSSGESDGTSSALAYSAASNNSDGSASGTATALAVGRALFNADGVSSGLATASAVGKSLFAGVGGASGTSSVIGWSAGAGSVGSAAGDCVVSGVGQSVAKSVGVCDGISSVLGVGSSHGLGVGESSGLSSALGIGLSRFSGAGSVSGVATASSVGRSLYEGVGSSSGSSSISGKGQSIAQSAGGAAGTSTVTGIYIDTTPQTPESRIYSIAAENRVLSINS